MKLFTGQDNQQFGLIGPVFQNKATKIETWENCNFLTDFPVSIDIFVQKENSQTQLLNENQSFQASTEFWKIK